MGWARSSLRDSLFGLLRHEAAQVPEQHVDNIRKAMLMALDQDASAVNSKLERSLLFAPDIDALWHARPALMSAVAAQRGEASARRTLADITAMFEGHIPGFKAQKKKRKRS